MPRTNPAIPTILPDLLRPETHAALAWRPFHPGVEIFNLYGDPATEPAAALLRYAPGAGVPEHEHGDFEHIFVLQGEQSDARGTYPAGTLVIQPPGARHAITSKHGCVVLAIWRRPVRFIA